MRKTILVLVSFTTLSLLSACYFTDSEWYKADPVADDPPEVSVITNLDTLYNPRVNDSLQVIYELSIVNGELYFMEAMVSDLTVHSSDSTYGSFWIYPSQSNETDLDTLYLDFYYSSNTNTLADIIGFEASITILKYVIDFSEEVEP
ncbi:MAG: hypothetical protein E4H10_11225 [Bacteroidia bacterium]|nr:MAG: hypothetical protein E4H10_11225 [Bacteroidia bacterium]